MRLQPNHSIFSAFHSFVYRIFLVKEHEINLLTFKCLSYLSMLNWIWKIYGSLGFHHGQIPQGYVTCVIHRMIGPQSCGETDKSYSENVQVVAGFLLQKPKQVLNEPHFTVHHIKRKVV